jgi:DNA repair protein RadA/Sms
VAYRCDECGASPPKWVGRCPECGGWGTLVEGGGPGPAPVPLATVDAAPSASRPTGIAELDRVLGGGLVPGSVTLLGGEPGIGKSTLLLQVLVALGGRSLLVSAEESAPQVRLRASRLGPLPDGLLVLAETSLPAVLAAVDAARPSVCVVDSIQTVADPAAGSTAGSVAQVRDCALALARVAKARGMAVVMVGHVTKDGGLAGPRVLEHLVDTVLSFEGDRHHALRLLRATKHRFGPTGELGLFEMTDTGMAGIADPGRMLLGDRRVGTPGSAVVTAVEGRRPLLVEVQALVGRQDVAVPRRSAQGVDGGRVEQLLAVLERRAGVALTRSDVFVSAVGGVRVGEPAADLGIALALASAAADRAVPADVVAVGEIGLAGELRQVPHAAWRLAEAGRMGFRRVVVPGGGPAAPAGVTAVAADSLSEVLAMLGLCPLRVAS